jgi:Domain of Unknown Function (DUF1080)
MIRLTLILILFVFVSSVPTRQNRPQWITLFNGKDLADWKIKIKDHPLNENSGNTFRIIDGKLRVDYDKYENFSKQFGHIFYKQSFSSYLLSVEYRFTGNQVNGGPTWAYRNSGVMIHAQSPESMEVNQDFPICIEVQFLGGNGKDERPTANLCTPGTHVVLNDKLLTDHCTLSASKTFHGEQWVRVDVLVLGDSIIKHIVQGDTVLVYKSPQIGGGEITDYDPKQKIDGKILTEGYIALQSESHPIEFRKAELFDLAPYRSSPRKLRSVLKKLSKQ